MRCQTQQECLSLTLSFKKSFDPKSVKSVLQESHTVCRAFLQELRHTKLQESQTNCVLRECHIRNWYIYICIYVEKKQMYQDCFSRVPRQKRHYKIHTHKCQARVGECHAKSVALRCHGKSPNFYRKVSCHAMPTVSHLRVSYQDIRDSKVFSKQLWSWTRNLLAGACVLYALTQIVLIQREW